jgi:hypothetical protein
MMWYCLLICYGDLWSGGGTFGPGSDSDPGSWVRVLVSLKGRKVQIEVTSP